MVMQAILERKCFPAGMELFPAIDTEQFEYIKKVIDDSDYYLLIIGARYGSIDENGVSFTEKEYDYAVEQDIPVIAFLHSDIKSIPLGKADVDSELQRKLEAFRKKVQTGRLVKYWNSPHDLRAKVTSSLVDVFDELPKIGWVRADSVFSEDGQKEISRLNNEITDLHNEVIRLEAELKEYKSSQIIKGKKSLPETETFTVRGVSFKMIHVKGGTFLMGAKDYDTDAIYNERPAHMVSLSDYWIGETQVTQALWQAVMGDNPSKFNKDLNCPVESVSWVDCRDFIRLLNILTGKKFRLPTEAQWEFAIRGGNQGKDNHNRFAGSNDIYDVAWFCKNSRIKSHPVGELDPNELGLYDMSGNVYEWCNDRYSFYSSDSQTDPTGPETGSDRVIRGGCWDNSIEFCRVTFRSSLEPTTVSPALGLRLAL